MSGPTIRRGMRVRHKRALIPSMEPLEGQEGTAIADAEYWSAWGTTMVPVTFDNADLNIPRASRGAVLPADPRGMTGAPDFRWVGAQHLEVLP